MGDNWLHGSSSRRGLWPSLLCRRSWLAGTTRLLCRLRHDFFYGGVWTEAPLSRPAHRAPVVLFPLIHGVERWNLLRQLQLSACNATKQVLDYSTREIHLVGGCLHHLQLLGDALLCHIARLSWKRGETSLQASRSITNEGDMGQSRSAEPRP
jgi:hypothetical protein